MWWLEVSQIRSLPLARFVVVLVAAQGEQRHAQWVHVPRFFQISIVRIQSLQVALDALPDSLRPYSAVCFYVEMQQNLATFDIILAPSDDNKFNRGKSAIRVYEGLCATKGQAAVVGSETTYGDTIHSLGCGFACKSFADWLGALGKLIEDGEMRRTLGQRGYERMMKGHTYQGHAGEWLEVYKKVLDG